MPSAPTIERLKPLTAKDERTRRSGLRAIATFEAIKGLVVLALGLGLLALLHKDVEALLEAVLIRLHIDPDRRLAHALVDAASRVTDRQLWGITAVAVAYAAVRFTEAWGLWHRLVWAEWFALLSGALYLPWEIEKLAARPNAFHAVLLLGNLAVVAYMGYVRLEAHRSIPCRR